jgi:hypothetical protein
MQVFGWGSGDALDHVGMPRRITFGGTTFKPCPEGTKLYWSSSTDPVTAYNWPSLEKKQTSKETRTFYWNNWANVELRPGGVFWAPNCTTGGTWEQEGDEIRITWAGSGLHTVQLSDSGKKLTGSKHDGAACNAVLVPVPDDDDDYDDEDEDESDDEDEGDDDDEEEEEVGAAGEFELGLMWTNQYGDWPMIANVDQSGNLSGYCLPMGTALLSVAAAKGLSISDWTAQLESKSGKTHAAGGTYRGSCSEWGNYSGSSGSGSLVFTIAIDGTGGVTGTGSDDSGGTATIRGTLDEYEEGCAPYVISPDQVITDDRNDAASSSML